MDNLLKDKMDKLEKDVGEIKGQMNRMYLALMGSDITKDGGMVQRIIDLEIEVATLKNEVQKNKQDMKAELEKDRKSRIPTEVYVKILWGVAGGFIVFLVNLLFSYLLK